MPRPRNTFPLMGIAAILIANSHLESLYPKRWMAADGLLGNTIFFLLAGYGILLSQRQRPTPFGIAMLLAPFYRILVNAGRSVPISVNPLTTTVASVDS